MADTYTQLYIHIIFAVKGRESLIPKPHKEELHKYITGIIDSKNQSGRHNRTMIHMSPRWGLDVWESGAAINMPPLRG